MKTLARISRIAATNPSNTYKSLVCISALLARAPDLRAARLVLPGARTGMVSVSFGMVIDCGPAEISLSIGKYSMLPPFLVSTMTLREFLYTFSMVSRYMRSRVTAGA